MCHLFTNGDLWKEEVREFECGSPTPGHIISIERNTDINIAEHRAPLVIAEVKVFGIGMYTQLNIYM